MNLPKERTIIEVEQSGVDFIPGPGHKRPGPDREAHLMDKRPTTFDEIPPFDYVPGTGSTPEDAADLTCPVCGKVTKHRGALTSHMRIHRHESH